MKSKHETRDWYGEGQNINVVGLDVNPKTFYFQKHKDKKKKVGKK